MEKISTTKPWENKYVKQAVGVAAGYGVYKYGGRVLTKPYLGYFNKSLASLTPQDNAAYLSIKNTVLNKYRNTLHVNIVNIDAAKSKEILEEYLPRANDKISKTKNPLKKYVLKTRKKRYVNRINSYAEGKNACYKPLTKEVYVNYEKNAFAIFHELGHALDRQNIKIFNNISKWRQSNKIAMRVLFILALLSKQKAKKAFDSDKKIGVKEKINEGLSNIDKYFFPISMIMYAPILFDEASASINANKMVKGILPENLHKKMNVLNAKAFGTYVVGALAVATTMKLGLILKNKIINAKSQK